MQHYIFTAGARKIIRDGAVVVWHGSMEQRNLINDQETYRLILEKKSTQNITAEEDHYLEKNARKYEYIKKLRDQQSDFFKKIGVNEYVTRIAQEETNLYKPDWTMTKQMMETFNIHSIDAPDDYGSAAYLKRIAPSVQNGHIYSIRRDASGNVTAE
ncbi:hypothetical protein GCM10011289_00830 [Paludibacterium paludis]|uniref:Uncharacterized protein n=2 Tax=Paludibacterium paludis TaxID=1225769 RepID=A0A918U6R6_9NEIS|nr:hypothetical protein GCM10011289_00830 [Paludibacterium paludis]